MSPMRVPMGRLASGLKETFPEAKALEFSNNEVWASPMPDLGHSGDRTEGDSTLK